MLAALRILGILVLPTLLFALIPSIAHAQSEVTVEWLGWNAWRFTSPTGKVILTNPFLTNPDAPIRVDDIQQADLILVTNGHGDEVGQAIQIAQNTGARIVASSFEFGSWFIDVGVPSTQVMRASPGERVQFEGITVRTVNSIHGSAINAAPGPTTTTPSGGIAGAFFITFENGWTVFFGGSSAATQDQALWGELYKPDAAIVHLSSSKEPLDFAASVRFLQTENPNLATVFPGHHRFGAPNIADAQAVLDA